MLLRMRSGVSSGYRVYTLDLSFRLRFCIVLHISGLYSPSCTHGLLRTAQKGSQNARNILTIILSAKSRGTSPDP